MYLLFAEYQGYVKPLFAYDDKDVVMHKCISIDAISDLVKLLSQSIEKITKHYVSGHHFKNADNGEFYALVKLIDNNVVQQPTTKVVGLRSPSWERNQVE